MKRHDGDGFGPTLAAERLETESGLRVSQETLRRWMVEAGLWDGLRKRTQHQARPERSAHAGELVILRGDICCWPGERRAVNWIMELVDDATGTIALRVNRELIWALAGGCEHGSSDTASRRRCRPTGGTRACGSRPRAHGSQAHRC